MNRLTQEEFIYRAKSIHAGKYDYKSVIYSGIKNKIIITCKIHGEFNQSADSHLAGGGCRKCYVNFLQTNRPLTTKKFIEKAINVHGNIYDYSNVDYKKNNKTVIIICKKHGKFKQLPLNHLDGHGCKNCSNEIGGIKKRLTINEFKDKANKIHNNKYDYSLSKYIKNSKKIIIICPYHGQFWQSPNGHLDGHGCIKCSGKNKLTVQDFVKKAKSIHNNKYDYSNIQFIKNNSTKVSIICPYHSEFLQRPDAHLNQKQGCPSCRESKGERTVKTILQHKNINFIQQKSFENCINPETGKFLKFDFFVPSLNLCIEFDGEQHFKPKKKFGGLIGLKKIQYRDEIKNLYCEKNGIKLIRIKFNQSIYKKLEII